MTPDFTFLLPWKAISPITQGRGTGAGAGGADTVGVETDIVVVDGTGMATAAVETAVAVETTGERAASVESETEAAGVETEIVVFVMLDDDGATFGPGDADVAVPEDVVVPVCACARDGDSKTAAKSVLITSRFTPG
jgi:hypothetical protein